MNNKSAQFSGGCSSEQKNKTEEKHEAHPGVLGVVDVDVLAGTETAGIVSPRHAAHPGEGTANAAPSKSSMRKGENHHLVDNVARSDVGEVSFNTTAHLDAQLAICHCNQNDNAIVLCFVTNAPLVSEVDGVILNACIAS